ncbi:MAG: class I SAM-dependent rRNA methyltransferase [Myxococcota bacterium]|nr:class I SAM-dependent rRNA methyltransferase [Myxococcota bacterium]
MAAARREIQLDKRSAEALRGGHPWVWPDAVDDLSPRPRLGEEVDLLDSVGSFIGRGLVDSGSGPAIRIFSREPRDPPLRKLLFRRIAAARRLRQRVISDGTDAYRLLNGEGDLLPGLVADRYGPVLVLRPDGQLWNPHLDAVLEAVRSEGGAGLRSVLLKPRDGEAELVHGEPAPDALVVSEVGRRYRVRPGHGQKTGFFLDQRPTRSAVQRLSRPGDRSLNLFSFTGGFSIAMALAGAEEVTSVDLSDSILTDCKNQFPLNGLDPKPHRFIATNVFEWLPKQATLRDKPTYDLVVCDPPALARKKGQLPAARSAYRRLHEGIASLVAKGGLLVTCSCTARLGEEELLEDARQGLHAGGRRIRQVLSRGGAGEDHPVPPGFPEGRYLTCLTLALD